MLLFMQLLAQWVDGHNRGGWPNYAGNVRLYPCKNIAPNPFVVKGVIFVACNTDAPWGTVHSIA